jgi:hypothetical protein
MECNPAFQKSVQGASSDLVLVFVEVKRSARRECCGELDGQLFGSFSSGCKKQNRPQFLPQCV